MISSTSSSKQSAPRFRSKLLGAAGGGKMTKSLR